MNCQNVGLVLACGWLMAGLVAAADPPCFPPAAAGIASKNAVAAASARQLELLCKKVGLEPKAEGNASLLQVYKLALAEAPRPRGDRLKPAAPTGMPTGAVMPRGGVVELDATEVVAEGILSLDIDGPQLSVHLSPMPASGVAPLQVSQLRQGAEYRWVLATKRQKYDGTFSLPDTETMQRTQARLQALAQLIASPATLLFLEAAIYDEEDLTWSRDRVIGALRRAFQN